MGLDKRLLRLAGATMLERNLAFLGGVFPTVALSVREAGQVPDPLPAGIEIVPDVVTGSPLAGIASVLARFGEPVFVLAADVAFPDRAAVDRVLAAFSDVDVALPVAEEHLEPLHAIYSPGCLPHIERLLAAGAHSILDLYPEVRVASVEFDSVAPFFNVNTPEDWDEARRRLATAERPAPTSRPRVPVTLSVVGRSGSGKTTLIEQLIHEFTRRGLRVGAVKRVARFDIDTPGKDSWRHAQAGATAYAVASSSRLAFVTKREREASLEEIVEHSFFDHDIVICEGYREEAPYVVEVVRAGTGHGLPSCPPEKLLALVTDADVRHPHRFALDDAADLAEFLVERLGLATAGA